MHVLPADCSCLYAFAVKTFMTTQKEEEKENDKTKCEKEQKKTHLTIQHSQLRVMKVIIVTYS
jgi:hypothetical protein